MYPLLRHFTIVGLVKAILEPCRDFLWEAQPRGPGLLVFNACTGETMRIWIVIIRLIEDSAGLPKPLCSHKQPAYIGAPIHAIYSHLVIGLLCFREIIFSCYKVISALVYFNPI